ncbi:HTTM domain-containing protein [Nannocystis radixulma]|nr:HTTM domain-containing protein [Nannocystis radixulma]
MSESAGTATGPRRSAPPAAAAPTDMSDSAGTTVRSAPAAAKDMSERAGAPPRSRLLRALLAPVDAAGLHAFRIAFGLLMFAGTVRFAARGWIHQLYVEPSFHFKYWGFHWLEPLPAAGMVAVFVALGALSLLVAAGVWYRPAVALFFVLFTYVELLDKATYLNHYYFVSVVALLMIALPLQRGVAVAPTWALWALRLQVGLVYFYAGLAKLRPDWLLHAQPLKLWLAARADFPVLGPLLRRPETAYAMSWAGAAFDLTVPFLLLHPRTRPFAYAGVLAFHGLTGALFPAIGMFPWIMAAAALVFFPPDWPRRLWHHLSPRTCPQGPVLSATSFPARPLLLSALALHFAVQLALPLRRFAYPGDTAWTEEGYRFAWQVMLVEKVGSVGYRVRDPDSGRVRQVDPEPLLTAQQAKQMAFQPDMILEYAHHLAAQSPGAEIRADVFVTYNGRPAARLVDPDVDLARERDGLAPRPWILPAPPRP